MHEDTSMALLFHLYLLVSGSSSSWTVTVESSRAQSVGQIEIRLRTNEHASSGQEEIHIECKR